MTKKSSHASNAKVQEQAKLPPEEETKLLKSQFEEMEKLDEQIKVLNGKKKDIVGLISVRTGVDKKVVRQIHSERKWSGERYASHIIGINDLKRKIGMQPEYNANELNRDKAPTGARVVADVRNRGHQEGMSAAAH